MNETTQIQFRVEVLQGKLPEVAVNAAIRLEATSVIIDRLVILIQFSIFNFLFSIFFISKSKNMEEKGLLFLPFLHK